jgi:hypothetical protein
MTTGVRARDESADRVNVQSPDRADAQVSATGDHEAANRLQDTPTWALAPGPAATYGHPYI